MRKGFTFIELVVAIVVIAITLMSVPLLLSQASRTNAFNLNQEAVLAGATKVGNILTFPWDDKLVGQQNIKYILDVTNGDNELDRYPNTSSTRRIGNFKANYRRKFDANQTFASITLGRTGDTNSTAFNDIDDFNGTTSRINGSGTGDYVKDINISTTVKYISDDANYSSSPTLNFSFDINSTPPSTNIKLIEVKVSDNTNNQEITTLRAFSANIGSYELLYRIFP